MNRNHILENPNDFSVEELYQAILEGVVTYEELYTIPEFGAKRRKQLDTLINGAEDDVWAKAQSVNTIETYQEYLDKYPFGVHVVEAKEAIERIKQQAEAERRREAARAEWEALPAYDIEAIRRYIKTHPDSPFLDEARQLIKALSKRAEEMDWNEVDKDDEYSLRSFIDRYPDGYYTAEAREILYDLLNPEPIDDLLEAISKIEEDTNDRDPIGHINNEVLSYLGRGKGATRLFMEEVRKNKNLLSVGVVRSLINAHPDLEVEFEKVVGRNFMRELMRNEPVIPLPEVNTPDKIERISTEFYFWGIPGSGKTCLMASLLTAANRKNVEDIKGFDMDGTCSGFAYLNYLMSFFRGGNNVFRLMAGNGQGSVAEMGFDLIDSKDKRHPITFIDMPGEAFKAMHKDLAGRSVNPFKSDLEVVEKLLVDGKSNNNQKVHIFVVEYGAHNKRDADGVMQNGYLQSATTYIRQNKIFEKKTDMICIIFTKADLVPGDPESYDWMRYLEENYYGFYNNLCNICKDNEINGGVPEMFWFSIGNVCFRNYCEYNEAATYEILNFIVDRTWKERGGRFGKLIRGVKK